MNSSKLKHTFRQNVVKSNFRFYTLIILLTADCRRKNYFMHLLRTLYSVETTYGLNSVISKLMTFSENVETVQFLFLIMLILSSFMTLSIFEL
jgi:hypothetical protein